MSKQIKKNRVEGDWLFQYAVSAVKTRSGFTNGIQLTRVRWQRQRQPHVGCTCDQSPSIKLYVHSFMLASCCQDDLRISWRKSVYGWLYRWHSLLPTLTMSSRSSLTMCHNNVSLSCEMLQFFYNIRCRCTCFWPSPGNQTVLMVSAHCSESALCREPTENLLHSPENVSSTCRHSAQGQISTQIKWKLQHHIDKIFCK